MGVNTTSLNLRWRVSPPDCPHFSWFLVTLQLANSIPATSGHLSSPFSSSLLLLGQQDLPPVQCLRPSHAFLSQLWLLTFLFLKSSLSSTPKYPGGCAPQSVCPQHRPPRSPHYVACPSRPGETKFLQAGALLTSVLHSQCFASVSGCSWHLLNCQVTE